MATFLPLLYLMFSQKILTFAHFVCSWRFFISCVIFIFPIIMLFSMKKKIAALKKKYSNMTAIQQKFIRYVLIIKIAIFILCVAFFVLAWYLLMKK